LGTPYTQIVADMADLAAQPPLAGGYLCVDNTGVGRAVVNMFRKARMPLQLIPITIVPSHTAKPAPEGGGWNVPKADLVAVMQTLVQSRRFHIVPTLPDAKVLGRELQAFRVKVNLATGNETFQSWRERDHDDCVLSVALACWYGERCCKRIDILV